MPLKSATNTLFVQLKAHGHFLLKGLETRRLEAQELFLFFFIYSTNDYLQIEYAERQQGLETTHLEPPGISGLCVRNGKQDKPGRPYVRTGHRAGGESAICRCQ